MVAKFETLIRSLIGEGGHEPVSGVRLHGQFRPDEEDGCSILRNLNAAFLLALSGVSGPREGEYERYLEVMKDRPEWGEAARFYIEGLKAARAEVERAGMEHEGFGKALEAASSGVSGGSGLSGAEEAAERLRGVFFPEGVGVSSGREERITRLREKRKVRVTRLNPAPIADPAREVLFTSNVLLTVPLEPGETDGPALSRALGERLREVAGEEQMYWYDHPIPMGVPLENNEAVYGLRGLDEAVGFEKQRGTVQGRARVACALSVSVTHRGLQAIARQYLDEELRRAGGLSHLDVYIFTEADTDMLLASVLVPAVERYIGPVDTTGLRENIGVDGEYGRHYTFLKALSALWQVLVNPEVRGTFKIDLDQVFPQRELVAETGASALEHLKSPLWGAEGVDSSGQPVALGMIAGTLVNERDISKSLFYPDVLFPEREARGEEAVFFSALPQALSTEAEMMARYDGGGLDGEAVCLERVHVTGGTNGILVESLRRYRPFTPVFIGRAEDQAYIMSVLFKEDERLLRYAHVSGLVMRHDKESFASGAIKAAQAGKLIGDYARVLWFSHYARALPWGVDVIKEALEPFTGCFISRIPFTVVCLQLALKAASLFAEDGEGEGREGAGFLRLGISRLGGIIRFLKREPNPLIEEYRKEREVWDMYYDVLDCLEEGIREGDGFALSMREKAREIVKGCRLG